MGNCFASVFRRKKVRRQIVLILIGLDNAGKTQTVNNLSGEKDDRVLPTVGFKAVNLVHKDTPVTIYDLGGGPHFRQIWSQYYSEVHGVIFVIDSSDFSRLGECKEVLEEVLSHDKISGKPVLILANKQDKTGALDDIDVVEKLNVEPLVNRYRCPTLVESYSASHQEHASKKQKIDPGLKKGYQWLLNYIIRRYGDINLRVQSDIHGELERRRRLQAKASNQESQTSLSEDLVTETGFENPNFNMTRIEDREKEFERSGVILVKPILNNHSSVDTTITIESNDVDGSLQPKLSPLFGHSTDSASEGNRVELEPRLEARKLSPIRKNTSDMQSVNFNKRPQSSPSLLKKIKIEPQSSRNSSLQSEDPVKGKELIYSADVTRAWDIEKKHRVLINDAELSTMHREIVLTERDYCRAGMSSDVRSAASLPPARPASASALVRRQLELSHKRRLSLRYMHRNRTSPESPALRPEMCHVACQDSCHDARHGKGDFQHMLRNLN